MTTPANPSLSRRDFLAAGAGAALWPAVAGAAPVATPAKSLPKGTADHCIFLWLGGGACHVDTWDPKVRGDAKLKKAGSYYDSIETSVPGVRVCEHLRESARVMESLALLRTVHHDVVDEHAAATNRLHTGRPTSGTIVYPSVGSIVSHERGKVAPGIPAYVVVGYPNLTRGPGFLGARHGYVYLTDTESGPEGLTRPAEIPTARQSERDRLLGGMRRRFLAAHPQDTTLSDYDAAVEEAQSLTRGEFMNAFRLADEPGALRSRYGDEFGQRCLLARRLVQRGVRFVEVSFNLNFINGTGWDTHNQGQINQHLLIQQLDAALATLIADLKDRRLLQRTLVVVATEFGRPPEFDGGGGRGHYAKAFSIVLAGGGLRTGRAVGVTDELGKVILERPISVPDLHATIHCALGINPGKALKAGDRPVPITDLGRPLEELFI